MIWPLAVDTWGDAEIDAITASLKEGQRTMGRQVKEFEEEFAAWVESRYAVMVNSGSSANLLLVSALLYNGKLRQGDTVVMPALGWSTTYSPFIQLGFKIELRDIYVDTLNMIDPDRVDANAGCVVHALGNPCYIGGKAMWIEDCCEALGSYYGDGAHVGTRGIGGTFSFFFSHQMSTGEGGMVITDDYELYCMMRSLRAHGWTRDMPWAKYAGCSDNWEFMAPGYNFRPLELQGAVGRVQLRRLPEFLLARRRNAVKVRDIVDQYPWIHMQRTSHDESSWMAFPMILDEGLPRQALRDALEERCIATRPVLCGNITRQPMANWLQHLVGRSFPNTDIIHDRGFMIGNSGFDLTSEQLDTLQDVLRIFGAGQ